MSPASSTLLPAKSQRALSHGGKGKDRSRLGRDSKTPQIGFISLGCPKALVDAERILTQLRSEGYAVSPSYAKADLIIVNTCGFIETAISESLEAIGEALEENGRVIVTGCLGARADQVWSRYPQLLAVTGPQAYEAVMEAVHGYLPPPHDPFTSLVPPQGIKLTPRHYAYLKIAEGCNHSCSFCIIPQLRGGLVSRPLGEVMREAENLVRAGVKELLIVAQDTGAYGLDLRYRTDFWQGRPMRTQLTSLATALGDLGVWVRMHYIYPYPSVDELLPLMAAGKILPYLDVPLQHSSSRILQAMRRPAATEKVLQRIERWRRDCPDITLRSTFIVGFPGETEEEFEALLAFLTAAQLDRVGCFTYSPVAGATANALVDAVPEALKQERWGRLMALQAGISAGRLRTKVGKKMSVLVDEVRKGEVICRGPGDAPEIDGSVVLKGRWDLRPGDFVEVEIKKAGDYDLWARPSETEA